MKSKSFIAGLMAVCMIASAPAFAQRYDNGNNRSDQAQRTNDYSRDQDRGRNDRSDRNDRNDRNYRNDRNDRNDRHGSNGYSPSSAYHGDRGAGPRHDLRRGGRLSSEYRSRQYVVNDWRGHRLSAPPRGSQWVQTGSDYVLVAIATGIIAQVLLSN